MVVLLISRPLPGEGLWYRFVGSGHSFSTGYWIHLRSTSHLRHNPLRLKGLSSPLGLLPTSNLILVHTSRMIAASLSQDLMLYPYRRQEHNRAITLLLV